LLSVSASVISVSSARSVGGHFQLGYGGVPWFAVRTIEHRRRPNPLRKRRAKSLNRRFHSGLERAGPLAVPGCNSA